MIYVSSRTAFSDVFDTFSGLFLFLLVFSSIYVEVWAVCLRAFDITAEQRNHLVLSCIILLSQTAALFVIHWLCLSTMECANLRSSELTATMTKSSQHHASVKYFLKPYAPCLTIISQKKMTVNDLSMYLSTIFKIGRSSMCTSSMACQNTSAQQNNMSRWQKLTTSHWTSTL